MAVLLTLLPHQQDLVYLVGIFISVTHFDIKQKKSDTHLNPAFSIYVMSVIVTYIIMLYLSDI